MQPTFLVTGGAGFVGSNLIKLLLTDHPRASIISVDNYFTGSRDKHVDNPRVRYLDANTIDIQQTWDKAGLPAPELVFHLGEYSRIVQSFAEVDLAWEYNVRGTKEIVKFAHQHGSKLVYAGSSSKFGNDGADENLNPYAWTKAKNVEYIRNFSNWYGLDYVVTYFYNAYGPGHIRDGKYATVIGIFERQYLSGEPLTVVSPGSQTRDFTHIDDIVSGVSICADKGSGDGYLLGTGIERPVIDVARMFGTEINMVPSLPGERERGRADATKAKELGWEPRRRLDHYIADFVASHPRP